MIESVFPKDIKIEGPLDSKGTKKLFHELAEKYPDQYADLTIKLLNIGADIAYRDGLSFTWEELAPQYHVLRLAKEFRRKAEAIVDDPTLSQKEKVKRIIELAPQYDEQIMNETLEAIKKSGGSFAKQLASSARGKPADFKRIAASDVMYVDHRQKPIPVPITRGFAQGLSPSEFWLATYGVRKGWIDQNLGTSTGGYLGKQLSKAAHRGIIVDIDAPDRFQTVRGLPVPVSDPDNVGALLAVDTGGFKRNTPLTPDILAALKEKGYDEILIRSAVVRKAPNGGFFANDVGLFENGRKLAVGDQIGLIAAQGVGEPITQALISSKHAGGRIGGGVSTATRVQQLQQMLQVPKIYTGGIAHSTETGQVTKIEPGPAGGYFVFVNDQPHFVQANQQVTVKVGDFVEAGDALSTGLPNPAQLVYYKGLGEGRRLYIDLLRKLTADMGMSFTRRNLEVVAASLLDHVRFTEPYKNYLPGEVAYYSWIEGIWEPREDAKWVDVDKAVGKYLEQPVLHYTIGTQVLPSYTKMLKKFNINKVLVHDQPPPFESIMIPAAKYMDYDPDWFVRFLGGTEGLRRSILRALYEGQTSDLAGTSFVPSLATGKGFATRWPWEVQQATRKTVPVNEV